MTNISNSSKRRSSMVDPFDRIQMHPSERALAKAYMRDAEMVADVLFGIGSGFMSLVAQITESSGLLSQRIKSTFKKLAHH